MKNFSLVIDGIILYYMRLKKRKDLVMLWRMSQFESVREVAQNPDILKLIFAEVDPMFQYNQVVEKPARGQVRRHPTAVPK